MARRSDDAGPRAAHRQENHRKRNGEATILRTRPPSGGPKPFFRTKRYRRPARPPPKERGVRRLQARAAHLAPAAVTANNEEAFTAQCETDPDDSANRDTEIRQGALRPSRASLHPTRSLQDGFGRIGDRPAKWSLTRCHPPWRPTDKQSGPGIADPRAENLQPLPHGIKTARNRCRANLQIHSSR